MRLNLITRACMTQAVSCTNKFHSTKICFISRTGLFEMVWREICLCPKYQPWTILNLLSHKISTQFTHERINCVTNMGSVGRVKHMFNKIAQHKQYNINTRNLAIFRVVSWAILINTSYQATLPNIIDSWWSYDRKILIPRPITTWYCIEHEKNKCRM